MLVLLLVIEGSPVDAEVRRCLRLQVLSEDRLPDLWVAQKDFRKFVSCWLGMVRLSRKVPEVKTVHIVAY